MEFLLAVLNSRLITYYHQQVVPEKDRVFAEVKIVDLEQIPFPRIVFTTPATKRAAQIENAKRLYEKSLTNGDAQGVLHSVEAESLAGRMDVVHDLLAFLAERMMAMNQQKRTTTKQFLTDLKDFHDVDPHTLKPKTKLDKFWKLEATEVFAHFRANKLRLKDSDEEKIRARFQKAKDELVPLETQIAFTDRLIDEIVYRLYGLTEAEIKIVSVRGCNSSMVRVA